jgi:hypothetical protein
MPGLIIDESNHTDFAIKYLTELTGNIWKMNEDILTVIDTVEPKASINEIADKIPGLSYSIELISNSQGQIIFISNIHNLTLRQTLALKELCLHGLNQIPASNTPNSQLVASTTTTVHSLLNR